jgi:ubiquinol-cytochrome c reductase subunit 6
MGIADFFSDIVSALSVSDVHAEAAPADDGDDETTGDEESEGKGEDEEKEDEGGDEETEEEAEEEEEEEEEEEPEDIKPKLEEECANSEQCIGHKNHYDDCVSRVTKQQEENENGKADEDCVEEFFHLTHCATQCAAPKLFRSLR